MECNSPTLPLSINRSSLVLFVNEGELAMTSRIYPNSSSIGVKVFVENGTAELVELAGMVIKSIGDNH